MSTKKLQIKEKNSTKFIDISKELQIEKVDPLELSALFRSKFSSSAYGRTTKKKYYNDGGTLLNPDAEQEEENRTVIYGNDELAVTYKKDSYKIIKVSKGQNLTDEREADIIKTINTILKKGTGLKYPHHYIFKTTSFNFYFKYKDKFQLFTLPNIPKPSAEVVAHPIILQYSYEESGSYEIDTIRRGKMFNEIISLLTALSPTVLTFGIYDFLKYSNIYSKHTWILPSFEGVTNNEVSEYRQIGYHSGISILDSEFYNTNISPFYTSNSLLEEILDLYYSLSNKDKEKIIRGCMWYEKAVLANTFTDQILNFVIMIESFLPQGKRCDPSKGGCGGFIPSTDKKCDKCGQYQSEIRKTFKEFVLSHIASKEQQLSRYNIISEEQKQLEINKEKKEILSYAGLIYDIRSGIAHSGKIVAGEDNNFFGIGIIPVNIKERDIVSWLKKACSIIIRSLIFEMSNKYKNVKIAQ